MDIRHDVVHHRLHDADRPCGEHGTLIVEPRHQDLGATVQMAEDVGGRHFDIAEHQLAGMRAPHAELVQFLRNAETGHALFDQKSSHTARAKLGFGLGIDHQRVGVRPIGDPHLAAIEQVITAFVFGLQLHADDIRTGPRLAHRQRTDMLAADQLGQVFLLLRLAAVALELVDAEVRVRAIGQADRSRSATDFFHRDHVRQIAHIGPAIFLGDGNAEHPELAHLAPQVHRELVARVDLGRARRDLLLRKMLHCIAQCVDLFAKLKIQARQIHRSLRFEWGQKLGSDGNSLAVYRLTFT